jgi:5-formyltetrahydrofolate cyclo-ligase
LELTPLEIEKASSDVCQKIQKFPEYQNAKMIAIYSPIYQEISPLELLNDSSKRFCFPKIIDFGDAEIEFFEAGTHFASGTYDIQEPTGKYVSKSEIDIIIVPGLVFSKSGYRIGYGKGFYDHFLMDYVGTSIGILYDFQLLDEIPNAELDVALKILVTNKEVLCIT